MKKLLSILLAVLLFSLMATPAMGDELPLVQETVTLNVLVQQSAHIGDFETQYFWQDLETRTNVHINWIKVTPETRSERIATMLASGEYPDVSFIDIGNADVMLYGQYGEILTLDDLIAEYAPNWTAAFEEYPQIKSAVTYPDGNIYSLPYVRMDPYNSGIRDAVLINKTWLDNLGLEVPTTMDELFDVLMAFKTQDPNGNGEADEIPYAGRFWPFTNSYWDLVHWFGSHFATNGVDYTIAVDDGEVYLAATQPEFKQSIEFLSKLYANGLIDEEFATQDLSQFQAKTKADPLIVGMVAVYHGVTEIGLEVVQDNYITLPPLTSDSGKAPIVRQQLNTVERGRAIIFKTNEYPELTMRWLNELATPENSLHSFYGYEELEQLVAKDDGTYDPHPENYATRLQSIPANTGGTFLLTPDIVTMVNKVNGADLLRKNSYEVYKDYVIPLDQIYPNVIFTEEQADTLNREGMSEYQDYVQTTVAKWIINGTVDSEWDQFCLDITEMAEPLMLVYQDALDAYNGK